MANISNTGGNDHIICGEVTRAVDVEETKKIEKIEKLERTSEQKVLMAFQSES